jgi:hypothetical protein
MDDASRPRDEAKRLQLKPALVEEFPRSKIGRSGCDEVNLPGFMRSRGFDKPLNEPSRCNCLIRLT